MKSSKCSYAKSRKMGKKFSQRIKENNRVLEEAKSKT
jgi:hypothetical protein